MSQRKLGIRFEESLLLEQGHSQETEKKREYAYERSFQLGRFKGRGNSVMGAPLLERGRKSTDDLTASNPSRNVFSLAYCWGSHRLKTFKHVLEDWIYLALLGFIMAMFSTMMDAGIYFLQNARMSLFIRYSNNHWVLSYMIWVGYTIALLTASAVFTHYVAPQAIGSGIPEMKTILRGVILKEYLTIKTAIAKMVGLMLALGSGLPLGREGPFVHVASVVANQISRLVHGTGGVFENESRSIEMLAAGCAVGVACTFGAPIGGVLFSIEVTTSYFAVRDYWRGFFAATCSATLFRVIRSFGNIRSNGNGNTVSVEAHYQTSFPVKDAYHPNELPIFAMLGLACGFLGAFVIYSHRTFVFSLRRNRIAKLLFQKYWIIYPILVTWIIASVTYPNGAGRYIGGEQLFGETLSNFFVNCTWTVPANHTQFCVIPSDNRTGFNLTNWTYFKEDGVFSFTTCIFVTLVLFQIVYFCVSILASTLPVPAGAFLPIFVLGGALGRGLGEFMSLQFPDGIVPLEQGHFRIYPGIYAVAGAAALCGAFTHTVSIAVVVFELTGQLTHLLPVMVAVLVANAVCSYLQPSIYDSIIKIKHLPYLPDIPHASSIFHQVLVEQFMISPVKFVARDYTYAELQELLLSMPRLRAFPLVESKERMNLLGSMNKSQLHRLLESKVGMRARQAEASRRMKEAIQRVDRMFRAAKEQNESRLGSPLLPADEVLDNSHKTSRFTVVKVAPIKDSVPDRPPLDLDEEDSRKPSTVSALSSKFLTNAEKEAMFAVGMGKKRGADSLDDHQRSVDVYHTIGGMFRSITKLNFGRQKKETKDNEFDLQGDERREWEELMLNEVIDLSTCHIDPSPFQLVEHTSIFKVHSLFSLLGLNRTYVTECGRLVGIVGRRELREAMEMIQSGQVPVAGQMRSAGGQDQIDMAGTREADFILPKLEVLTRQSTVESYEMFMPQSESAIGDYTVVDEAQLITPSNRLRKMSNCTSDPCLVSKKEPDALSETGTMNSHLSNMSSEVLSRPCTPDIIEEPLPGPSRQRRRKDLHVKIVIPDGGDSSD